MPSLVQETFGAGYGLVRDNSSSIVALGAAGGVGANVLQDESGNALLDESSGQLLDQT